jgi:hypothetical protein
MFAMKSRCNVPVCCVVSLLACNTSKNAEWTFVKFVIESYSEIYNRSFGSNYSKIIDTLLEVLHTVVRTTRPQFIGRKCFE